MRGYWFSELYVLPHKNSIFAFLQKCYSYAEGLLILPQNCLQNAPGRRPGGPWRTPDGPKSRPKSGKKKMKSVQEGPKTGQEAKFGAPGSSWNGPKTISRCFCKYFFTFNVKKYWNPFLDHFWPENRVIFLVFLYHFCIIFQKKLLKKNQKIRSKHDFSFVYFLNFW